MQTHYTSQSCHPEERRITQETPNSNFLIFDELLV
jgi:hypothetical protein